MLSRVADAIYWMARYRERAENIARLIDVNLFLSIDAPGNDAQQWEPILLAAGDEKLFTQYYGAPSEENAIKFLTFDENNPNSIFNCLKKSRENARSIREVITAEMWNELNTLYLEVQELSFRPNTVESMFDFCAHIRRACQLFTGIKDTTMSHNEPWHFGRIGNLIERADQTTRILDVKYFILLPSVDHVGTAYDDILWAAVLQSVSGLEMYRQKYPEIRPDYVIDFLILNPSFPRSVLSCLQRARGSLKWIAESHGNYESEPIRFVEGFVGDLVSKNVDAIIEYGIHEYLEELQEKLSNLSESIYKTYIEVDADAMEHCIISGGGVKHDFLFGDET